jgi:single-strand DNA-binding protein
MRGLNRIQILGNVGAAPEVKTSAAGNEYARFSLATSERWADGERTDWHRCIVFGKLVGVAQQLLDKGTLALVEGRMEYEEYEKDGIKMRNATVHVQNLHVMPRGEPKETREPMTPRPRPAGGDDLPF